MSWRRFLHFLSSVSLVVSSCYDPSPAFPVPEWKSHEAALLRSRFDVIEANVKAVLAHEKYDAFATSVVLTSASDTIWSHFHSARKINETRPGATKIDADSIYRVASVTKTFTVLGILQQQKAGNLSLDDPVNKYLTHLGDNLPWKDITLRILASQLSGIPCELFQMDVINELADPSVYGLPPATKKGLPNCASYSNYEQACSKDDLYKYIKHLEPLFAPNQRTTYSNVAYEVLGLVLEKVSGQTYTSYLSDAIFGPLDMTSASNTKPDSDKHAVLPANCFNYWDVDEGIQSPTGAVYASAADLTKYLRYILSHYNTLATGVNWLLPSSWAGGMGSYVGMPWEIFRTDRILKDSRRPVTFVTKSGVLPGYSSKIYILEEYGLALTILVGGDGHLVSDLEEAILPGVVRQAESVIWDSVDKTYAGRYMAAESTLNSSIVLSASPSTGLIVESFVANGTDVLHAFLEMLAGAADGPGKKWRVQLTPTLLFKNATEQKGEVWYFVPILERGPNKAKIFDEFCVPAVDTLSYAGTPLLKIIFWREEGLVELPAWNLTLQSQATDHASNSLFVQSGYFSGLYQSMSDFARR